jgi:ubiquinone/menaquinone biosynthesis C-methylase UbiE
VNQEIKERGAMSTRKHRQEGPPNTYVMQNSKNGEELHRLQIQDHLITASMGGVLPEQPDPARFCQVLDVGCGIGGWLIEAAAAFPGMTLLVGVDINERMLTRARAQAEAAKLNQRIEFRAMDALLKLDFPDSSFDLVNLRFGVSWLRTWDWPKLLQELQRVTRPGGVIRISERGAVQNSNSSALLKIEEVAVRAFYQAGFFFAPNGNSVIDGLAHLLTQHGLQQVQTRAHVLEFRGGTPEGQNFAQDYQHAYQTIVPFLQKWTHVPDNYEEIYQQMVAELYQPDSVSTWNLLTAWGTTASAQEPSHEILADR